jgi:hypothetical protein
MSRNILFNNTLSHVDQLNRDFVIHADRLSLLKVLGLSKLEAHFYEENYEKGREIEFYIGLYSKDGKLFYEGSCTENFLEYFPNPTLGALSCELLSLVIEAFKLILDGLIGMSRKEEHREVSRAMRVLIENEISRLLS